MDVSLRRDLWIVGSVCLISSSLLWRTFRCVMTRGRPQDTQEKATVWSPPGLKEMAPVKGKRTSASPERSSQKSQPSSKKDKVHKLNEKNAEKTHASLVQGSFATFGTERPQDEIEGFAPRKYVELRGNTDDSEITDAERRIRPDNDSPAGDGHTPVGENGCPVSRAEKREPRSKEDAGERENNGIPGPPISVDIVPARHSDDHVAQAPGDALCERGSSSTPGRLLRRKICGVSSGNALPTPGVPGPSAAGSLVPSAEHTEPPGTSKRRGAEERGDPEVGKKSRMAVAGTGERRMQTGTQDASLAQGGLPGQAPGSTDMKTSGQPEPAAPQDDALAPPAPFSHRIVTAKQTAVSSLYTLSRAEVLGGGRFGQVHKCEEKATGLKLAAKIIKTRGTKEKDEAKNEITIMNQLDHANLIQLYDAFESKNDIVLVMEYVDGGELFDRIIDDRYNVTEADTVLFIKQICEGIRHMHQMYILHLDLKPENILCVNRDAKQIKIIDFGLARRYKPREKLKVNFGTPEFLAPEVVNYDFVSFPTDMWSVGVIAYMLLSGLSPFLGDNDAETLSNILACRWDLEEEEFQDVSEEGKEFISKLLIKEKSWRMSASEALKHPWLSDPRLHSQHGTQKNRGPDAQKPATK